MTVIGLDPGPVRSAIVALDGLRIVQHDTLPNAEVLRLLSNLGPTFGTLVIEKIEAMGMTVGAEVFETVFHSGRFAQAWRGPWDRVTRRQVKLHLCGHMRAKDPNVRQALIDRFSDGQGKEIAIGRAKQPGPLFGIAGDRWSALAVAVTWLDTCAEPSSRPSVGVSHV